MYLRSLGIPVPGSLPSAQLLAHIFIPSFDSLLKDKCSVVPMGTESGQPLLRLFRYPERN